MWIYISSFLTIIFLSKWFYKFVMFDSSGFFFIVMKITSTHWWPCEVHLLAPSFCVFFSKWEDIFPVSRELCNLSKSHSTKGRTNPQIWVCLYSTFPSANVRFSETQVAASGWLWPLGARVSDGGWVMSGDPVDQCRHRRKELSLSLFLSTQVPFSFLPSPHTRGQEAKPPRLQDSS